MPMKTKRISADEAIAKRKDHTREIEKGLAIVKAAKAPASWDKDQRSARFVMSTGAVDRYGDIVGTEGIDTTEFERNPVGLLFHNSRTWPVAHWGNLEKILKGRPPRLEGDFILLPAGGPIKEIDETEWMLANGGVRACSIGFIPDWDNVEAITDDEGYWTGFKFLESELVECSVCAVPANAGALVKSAGRDLQLAKELLEDTLDNWARSPEGLLMPRADFEKQYRTVVEKIAKPKLPVTDEERADADQLSVAVEVAKLLPATSGTTCVVQGARSTKLAADGKVWTATTGPVEHGARANFVVDCKIVDDKYIYEDITTKLGGAKAVGELQLDGDTWAPVVEKGFDADKLGLPLAPGESATMRASDGSSVTVALKADTSEIEESVGRVNGLLDGLREKLAGFFGKQNVERVEPHFDPPAPPSDGAIAAARAAAARARANVSAKGLL